LGCQYFNFRLYSKQLKQVKISLNFITCFYTVSFNTITFPNNFSFLFLNILNTHCIRYIVYHLSVTSHASPVISVRPDISRVRRGVWYIPSISLYCLWYVIPSVIYSVGKPTHMQLLQNQLFFRFKTLSQRSRWSRLFKVPFIPISNPFTVIIEKFSKEKFASNGRVHNL
jgi:hypothetical protein